MGCGASATPSQDVDNPAAKPQAALPAAKPQAALSALKLATTPDNWTGLLGPELVLGKGQTDALAKLTNADCVGLFFGAGWCEISSGSNGFLQRLAAIYRALDQAGKKFEVVYCSMDKTPQDFACAFEPMPWLGIKPLDCDSKGSCQGKCPQQVRQKFGVTTVPMLVLLDSKGDLVSTDGRRLVVEDPEGKRETRDG